MPQAASLLGDLFVFGGWLDGVYRFSFVQRNHKEVMVWLFAPCLQLKQGNSCFIKVILNLE